uniref:SH2 domain-containing protein n=1 Tax=Globisporangium ultimum (strain ATCC 200006 / CBS 805.95 / DAOM BR144) TaxID=431595 RepID=K3XA55_GLOUD
MAAIFAHLHSSPLVVRRSSGSEWRSLRSASSSSASAVSIDSSRRYGNGLEAVDIIDVKEERKLLVQCVRESKKRIVWHSEVADLHTFRKVLSYGCRALHFSGHGVPGKVIFENKKCEAQFISQQELKDLLLAGGMEKFRPPLAINSDGSVSEPLPDGLDTSDSGGEESDGVSAHEIERGWIALEQHQRQRVPVKLVFVSACHSESVAEAFVSVGVPHVVVVSKDDKVLDKKAMEFSKAFYTALFAGHSVAKAFEIGQVQADISIMSDAGNSKFKLLGDGDHSEKLFRDVPEGKFIENSIPPPVNECDAVAEVFVGRSLEVHHVYKSLVEGARLVSITGERGIGKTEIALQCAQYAAERHLFKHIFFLRLETDDESPSDDYHKCAHDVDILLTRFSKSLGVTATVDADELAKQVRLKCSEGNFLLILDGCNRKTRRDPRFRSIISLLLRRVSDLSLLLTGDGKVGAMDGVGEKIVTVDRLPPADAALLFTLRAPRKIKTHEMGGNPDLAVFGEHPVIRSLMGHPRTICAVSQFLENKDMELDQHEFLNYIIPSVNAGLNVHKFDETTGSAPRFIQEALSGNSMPPAASLQHHHNHHRHVHHQHPQSWDGNAGSDPAPESVSRRMKPAASQGDVLAKTHLEHSHSERGLHHFHHDGLSIPHPLVASYSESDLKAAISATSQRQLCILKVADHVKWAVPDEEGRLVWAHAAVANSGLANDEEYTAAVIHRLLHPQMPLEWIAPQISRYFATQLKHDAVKRPLSLRSIDFLSKSTLVWGGKAPAQQNGLVTLEMFARAPPGTFLIRFSETRQRCFVIAYVHDDQCVQFVPVTCKPQSGWYVALQEDNSGVTFPTIQDLILSVTVLKYLFPQTPKEVAFQIHL